MAVRVGIDVGGTFTDLVLHDAGHGVLKVEKVLSTSPDPGEGVFAGLKTLVAQTETTVADVSYFAHASTVASNLILERKGQRTALLTTEGFRDILHLQRQKRADLYDVLYEKPRPLVARRDIYEVNERVAADGTLLQALDEESVRATLVDVLAKGISTIAVVLLHSYANPQNERRIRDICSAYAPDLLVSLSSDVSPKLREYERSSTTVMNAYVMRPVVRYLDSMQESLQEGGLRHPLHVMQCSGGVVVAEGMKRTPVRMLESGPAAGVLAAGFVGRMCAREHVISFDMGGTTAKVSIIDHGDPYIVEEFEVARGLKLLPGSGLPVTVPAIDLIEIGTGGGSVAHLEMGVLAIGPESAGASPGPACYGRGGHKPTVTDANLVLGYLDPSYFLGGSIELNRGAATDAIEKYIAQPLNLTIEEAAFAMHSLANASMANAMRVMTVQRGLDPRAFSAIAFGGAGPSHIAGICGELGVREAIVPRHAGVASALGLLVARVRFEYSRTLITRLEEANLPTVNAIYRELETRAHTELSESNVNDGAMLVRQARMRYIGQGYEISVSIPNGELVTQNVAEIRAAFLETYRLLYGFADQESALEVVDWRLTALGPETGGASFALRNDGRETEECQRGEAYFPSLGGYVEVDVWNRYALVAGYVIEGPGMIQERESTTLVPPNVVARIDSFGNVVMVVPDRRD